MVFTNWRVTVFVNQFLCLQSRKKNDKPHERHASLDTALDKEKWTKLNWTGLNWISQYRIAIPIIPPDSPVFSHNGGNVSGWDGWGDRINELNWTKLCLLNHIHNNDYFSSPGSWSPLSLGSKTFVHIKDQRQRKWDPRARKLIFVGYDSQTDKVYRVMIPKRDESREFQILRSWMKRRRIEEQCEKEVFKITKGGNRFQSTCSLLYARMTRRTERKYTTVLTRNTWRIQSSRRASKGKNGLGHSIVCFKYSV